MVFSAVNVRLVSNYEPTRAAVVIEARLRLRGTEGNRFVRERPQPGVTVAPVSMPTPVLAVLWLLSVGLALYVDAFTK